MRNKVLFGIFTVIIFILASMGCLFGLKLANKKRISLATFYNNKATYTQNSDQKLTYLIKSDSLVPKSEKKIQIATLLFEKDEALKAENYLIFTPNEQGNVLLTEYYLLNKPESAVKYLNRIKNSASKQELKTYLALLNGKESSISNLKEPQTDLGRLLFAINTQDLSQIKDIAMFSKLNESINAQSANHNNQMIALSQYYLAQNQPNLAIYVLNTLKMRTGELPIIDKLLAEAYFKLSNKESINFIAKAISLEPENQTLYLTGITYARHFGDNSKADFWADRLKDLKNFQK